MREEKNITDIRKVDKNIVEEYITFTKERGKYSYITSNDAILKAHQDSRTDIGTEISEATLNNYLRNINVFFTYLEENNIISENKVKQCKLLKAPRKCKEQLTDYEYQKLIKSIDIIKFHEYRDYIITNIIFDTGMRLGETLSLTINDVDLTRRTISISASNSKSNRDRVVFYGMAMAKLLQRWLRFKDGMQESELLFSTQRTNGLLTQRNFERNFRIYLSRVKINKKITPHGLRNNFARRFLLASKDIHILNKLLGHSSITTTEKAYLDLMDDDFRKQYGRFSPLENMNN